MSSMPSKTAYDSVSLKQEHEALAQLKKHPEYHECYKYLFGFYPSYSRHMLRVCAIDFETGKEMLYLTAALALFVDLYFKREVAGHDKAPE